MNLSKFKVLVVDDESDARSSLIDILNETAKMEVIGEADSVSTAISLISNFPEADLLFLDIKLIGGDAFMILDRLTKLEVRIPPVVLNTAFDEFELAQKAMNHYHEHIVMILKKPYTNDWDVSFLEIIKRLESNPDRASQQINVRQRDLVLKSLNHTHIIPYEDLYLIESDSESKGKSKVNVKSADHSITINMSLSKFERELPFQFVRISRFSIVNINHILSINNKDQLLKVRGVQKSISYGFKYKSQLFEKLHI